MAQHLQGRLLDYTLDGVTSLLGRIRSNPDGPSVDAGTVLNAAYAHGSVRTLEATTAESSTDISGFHGGVFRLPSVGVRRLIDIGDPGIPGRVFRVFMIDELANGGRWEFRTRLNRSSAANTISGLVGINQAARYVYAEDERYVALVGHSSTTANNPQKGDWLEFIDLGDVWHVKGASYAANAGAVVAAQ